MSANADHAADYRLLLSCCAPDSGQTVRPTTAELAGRDWCRIASLARRHGVTPLVARRLGARLETDAPNTARQRIVADGRAIQLRNQYLAAQLVRLCGELQSASIEVLALKGPVLGAIAYGDPGLRTFADLDLLVPPTGAAPAARILARLGFKADLFDEAAVSTGFFDAVEANFQRPDGFVNVDLHWDLAPAYYYFGPHGQEAWERALEVVVEGVPLRTLGPEDHLLYIAVHASRHGWPALSHVCDLAHYAARVALDWPTLLARASASRSRPMLDTGLLLAHDLFNIELPTAVLAAAQANPRAVALAEAVAANLAGEVAPTDLTLMRRARAAIASRGDRARYVARRAFAPTLVDWRFRPLPRVCYPAYYLLRPLRIGFGLLRRNSAN